MARAVQAVQEQRTPEFMSSVETGAEAASYTASKMSYIEKRTMRQNPLAHETCRLMMEALQDFCRRRRRRRRRRGRRRHRRRRRRRSFARKVILDGP